MYTWNIYLRVYATLNYSAHLMLTVTYVIQTVWPLKYQTR